MPNSKDKTYICGMKKIIRSYRRWRYRRLYFRLFMLYSGKDSEACSINMADYAGTQASIAFQWLTGLEWNDVVEEKV